MRGAFRVRNLLRYGIACAVVVLFSMAGCSGTTASVTPEEARAIAKEAYVHGFPMVMNYKTLYNYVVDTENPEYKGPFNQLSCEARLFTPDDKAVVTPNADTPYCMFWMDLGAEPMVLTVPEMEPERFYHSSSSTSTPTTSATWEPSRPGTRRARISSPGPIGMGKNRKASPV